MHALIVGVTQSGKTTLAHLMAEMLDKAGERIIVFDPVGTKTAAGQWPVNSVFFSDEDEFFDYVSRDDVFDAHVFVDEAAHVFTTSKFENTWLLSRGRHKGFSVYMIAVRPKTILPTARHMAGVCYVFRLASDDMRDIGKDFGFTGLEKISLDRGEFVRLVSGASSYEKGNVFNLVNHSE